MIKKILCLSAFLFYCSFVFSQSKFEFIESEEKLLKRHFKKILNSRDDEEKRKLNQKVLNTFSFILSDKLSFEYSFDSLEFVGIIKSSDNLMRIYSWNLAYNDGSYEYFGFIQYFGETKKSVFAKRKMILYTLEDHSKDIRNAEFKDLNNVNWYGALYYDMIVNEYKKQTYYTLLAWDGNDEFSNKKIIDVIYFTDDNTLNFGAKIFDFDNEHLKSKRRRPKKKQEFYRLIFEFAEKATMILRYTNNRIVFDNLSPSSSSYEGEYQYYGPDASYNSFVFKKGKWRFVENVDVRNPKKVIKKKERKEKKK